MLGKVDDIVTYYNKWCIVKCSSKAAHFILLRRKDCGAEVCIFWNVFYVIYFIRLRMLIPKCLKKDYIQWQCFCFVFCFFLFLAFHNAKSTTDNTLLPHLEIAEAACNFFFFFVFYSVIGQVCNILDYIHLIIIPEGGWFSACSSMQDLKLSLFF